MHQQLLINAFLKIKKEHEKATGIQLSDTAAAKLLSDFIFENQNHSFGERRLIDYYRMAKREEIEEVIIKDPRVVQAMCEYLGFKDFSDFKKESNIISKEEVLNHTFKFKIIEMFRNHRLIIILCALASILVIHLYSNTKQRWMIWVNDKYVEMKFDSEKYSQGMLKSYDEEVIKNFKKVNVACETDFFESNGMVKIWYGKNINKELEFFTLYGLHPETGKTLSPISDYMIKKYICTQ